MAAVVIVIAIAVMGTYRFQPEHGSVCRRQAYYGLRSLYQSNHDTFPNAENCVFQLTTNTTLSQTLMTIFQMLISDDIKSIPKR